jgi:hypothetical protein
LDSKRSREQAEQIGVPGATSAMRIADCLFDYRLHTGKVLASPGELQGNILEKWVARTGLELSQDIIEGPRLVFRFRRSIAGSA